MAAQHCDFLLHDVQTKVYEDFQTRGEVISTLWLRFLHFVCGTNRKSFQFAHRNRVPLRVNGAGYLAGVSMLMDPRLEDYYAALFSFYGIQVLVHGNHEYPKISARGILLSPLKEAFLQVRHYLVSVSANIHSLHTQFCLYQQVSIAPTFINICISKFSQTQLSFLSVSASIHSPHLCLYQQVSCPSTLIRLYHQVSTDPTAICIYISMYPVSQRPSFSVSACIHSTNPPLYLYQPVSTAPTLIVSVSASIHSPKPQCVCISRYQQPPRTARPRCAP